MISNPIKIALFVFDDVELLDFAGPLEVFSAVELLGIHPVEINLIAKNLPTVTSVNGLIFQANHKLHDSFKTDLFIVPGGVGTKIVCKQKETLDLIKNWHHSTKKTFSVCTGARILAHCNLLSGLEVTTHHTALEELQKLVPNAMVYGDRKFIDNEKIITAAGVSSGIEASLYLVEKFFGKDAREKVVRYIEWE